jgi:hypothetical protein
MSGDFVTIWGSDPMKDFPWSLIVATVVAAVATMVSAFSSRDTSLRSLRTDNWLSRVSKGVFLLIAVVGAAAVLFHSFFPDFTDKLTTGGLHGLSLSAYAQSTSPPKNTAPSPQAGGTSSPKTTAPSPQTTTPSTNTPPPQAAANNATDDSRTVGRGLLIFVCSVFIVALFALFFIEDRVVNSVHVNERKITAADTIVKTFGGLIIGLLSSIYNIHN